MAEPAVATPPAAPVVKVNDLTTGRPVSVYVGGDPQIPLATDADRAARGDVVETPKDPLAQDPPKEDPPVEEEPPPAAAKKDEPEPERDEKGRFVTKKRFDEVNERRRQAEERLAQIDREKAAAGKATETAYDFEAKEKQYIDLILDGKTEDAAKLRSEIRAAEQAQFEKVATTKAAETNRALTTEQQINAVVADYEARIPAFNPENEAYSEDLLDDVNAFYTGYLQGKKFDNPADAFKAAITKALKVHGIEDKPTAPATNGTAALPVRTAAKRIDAIKNQPPNIARAGNGGAEHGDANIRVNELSEAEFARLPEATRRRLRGDNL